MEKDKFIESKVEDFLYDFRKFEKQRNLTVPELSDDSIRSIISEFFNKISLTQARQYFNDVFNEKVEDPYNKINWKLGRPEVESTPEFIAWRRHHHIESMWRDSFIENNLDNAWVEVHGLAHTNEEVAKIAADKWCELIFGNHIQDNGAINENHPGGFYACALATQLADKSKENLTEDIKNKAHDLFEQYYQRYLHYSNTSDYSDIEWLKTTFYDDSGEFKWDHGFDIELYCDYGPSWGLFLILYHAGVPKNDIHNICPWKTGIYIRKEDNTIIYRTYQHSEEL